METLFVPDGTLESIRAKVLSGDLDWFDLPATDAVVVDDHVWCVFSVGKGYVFVLLLRWVQHPDGVEYRVITEGDGPACMDVPLEWLDKYPRGCASHWRDEVRRFRRDPQRFVPNLQGYFR